MVFFYTHTHKYTGISIGRHPHRSKKNHSLHEIMMMSDLNSYIDDDLVVSLNYRTDVMYINNNLVYYTYFMLSIY